MNATTRRARGDDDTIAIERLRRHDISGRSKVEINDARPDVAYALQPHASFMKQQES